jgi:DNA-binding Lrp family transcriptional regulator
MSVKAYIFINLSGKNLKQVLTKLRASNNLYSAEATTGPYDIITTAEAEDIDALGELITQEILGIEGIERTLTCFVLHL